ncbi:MAG: Na/Pi cotransporter family protein, partial [Acutalibacteraceae bacterium]
MTVFSITAMLGGLAFFLYGMSILSGSLEKAAGGAFEKNLKKVTSNRFMSLLLGAGITVAIQSSSALTVMLVGLVNSGIIEFGQTIGILMGSNIGTTVTAWILSLAGIDSNSFWINLLKPKYFSPIFALIGIILYMTGKTDRKKNTGNILIGFSILMYGMEIMSETVKPLADSESFVNILTAFKNPILALLVGIIFTAVIQSSSASVGVLQALSTTGAMSYGAAIPIIMGLNIGTCITSVISSIGVNRNAKKVAAVHLAFNIIGTVILFIPFLFLYYFSSAGLSEHSVSPIMIAVLHTFFNIATTFILLPFTKFLEKFANKVIKDDGKTDAADLNFDSRLLTVPSVAVSKAFDAAVNMAYLAQDAFLNSLSIINSFDSK